MSFFKSKSVMDCHNEQLARMVNQDFPWLWSIHNCWTGVYDNPRVSQDMNALGNLLNTPSASAGEKFELWIAFGSRDIGIWLVQKVKAEHPGVCWAQEIIGLLSYGGDNIYYITTVVGGDVTVYRASQKSEFSIQKLIEQTAKNFEALHSEVSRVYKKGSLLWL